MPAISINNDRAANPWRNVSALLPIATGLLLALCFAPLNWTALAWVALLPLAAALAVRDVHPRIYWSVWVGGLLFHLVGLDWIRQCYAGNALLGPFTPLLLLAAVVDAIWLAAVFWWGRRLSQRTRLPMTLLLPIVWMLYEISREALHLAIDGSCGAWLNLALTQLDTGSLAQVIDIGGQHTLTLLICLVNGAIFDAGSLFFTTTCDATARRHRLRGIAVAIVLVSCASAYGNWRLGQSSPRGVGPDIALMPSVDLPPVPHGYSWRWDFGKRQPQLLIWSEMAYHHRLLQLPYADDQQASDSLPVDVAAIASDRSPQQYAAMVMQQLHEASRQTRAALLMGCQTLDGSPQHAMWRHNSLVFVDHQHADGGYYHKVHLVPWREVIPHSPAADPSNEPTKFVPGGNTAVFTIDANRVESRKFRFGCALCYDVCFARHFRAINRAGNGRPDFYVQCGSEGQDGGASLSRTMLRMARLRAIENRRAVVRNAENGFSGVIDGSGRQIERIAPGELTEPRLLDQVPVDQRFSLYAFAGEWLTALVCLAALSLHMVCHGLNARRVARKW